MTTEEYIKNMKWEMELLLFDPSTGGQLAPERLTGADKKKYDGLKSNMKFWEEKLRRDQHEQEEKKSLKEKSWKQNKLAHLRSYYGKHLPKCEGHLDDRRVFVIVYNKLIEAVGSLPDEPHLYVKNAMNHEMKKDLGMMQKIIETFWEKHN